MGQPRIVALILVVGLLAAANRFTPGLVQAVLILTAIYLAVTHGDKFAAAFTHASAGLARGFTPARPSTTGPR